MKLVILALATIASLASARVGARGDPPPRPKTVLQKSFTFDASRSEDAPTMAYKVPAKQAHPKPPVEVEPRGRPAVPVTEGLRQSGCAVPEWQADGYCDDENNTPQCEYDGGDCCDNDMEDWDYFCSVCECLDGCAVPSWQADGYCDDENNTPECEYDGGDCCDNDMQNWDYYCSVCECLENPVEGCEVPSWEGDGFCDDGNNNAGCNWDGGDCCDNPSSGWDDYCNSCECLDPSAGGTTAAPPPTLAPGNCQCGVVNTADRIVGGQEVTPPGKYPYQAALTNTSGFFFCGGTIISDRHIMTAAHCTDGQNAGSIIVRLGEHDKTNNIDDTPPVNYAVAEIIQDPTYDSTNINNDFSILKLSTPITFRNDILPACLPANANNDYVNYKAIVSGWGTLKYDGSTPNTLQEVEVPVLANTNCGSYPPNEITSAMMCAGVLQGGIDACQGDSGGPLVTFDDSYGVLIGVVSWGYGCAAPNYPGVYARVTARLDWINNNIADGVMCPAPA